MVEGALSPIGRFRVPLHRRPDDLVEIGPGEHPPHLDASLRFARKTAVGLREHPDRAAIAAGALSGRGLELVYVESPIDAFFIHVQGSARIRLTGGGEMRVTYAAKSGHPYTPIGRVLVEAGALQRDNVTMQTIRTWLGEHPGEAEAMMARNRSYIFFREAPASDPLLGPIGAAKVPLTPTRSLAVDRLIHSFHTPVWVETRLPDGRWFRRLMIAQDTGSAIVGPARGDIFFGSGAAAGAVAGAMRAGGRFVVLMPRGDGR
ncbi:MAG: MltA domain-containing protein [Bauldia sp.]